MLLSADGSSTGHGVLVPHAPPGRGQYAAGRRIFRLSSAKLRSDISVALAEGLADGLAPDSGVLQLEELGKIW